MIHEIQCEKDLGVQGCEFVARGETAGDVVDQVVSHLRHEHKIKMPGADAILSGQAGRNPIEPEMDKGASTVVRRLQESLKVGPEGGGTLPGVSE
jgi:predicted small metal-binding protein